MTEMDVEMEFLSLTKYCKPTTSQEARLLNHSVLRKPDDCVDSIQAMFSSSTVLMASDPTRNFVISQPGSSDSINKHTVEEDPVFLTPPESHSPSHLSSEDQNPNHFCAEGMTIFEAAEGSYRTTKVRVLEAGLADEPEAKRVRVEPGEEFEGETVPLDDTEVVQIETDEAVQNTTVVSENGGSGGEKCHEVKLKSDASGSETVHEISKDGEMPKDIHIDERVRSNGKTIQEIEEFRYTGDVNGKCERTGRTVGVSGRRRQLPPSLKGKEKEVVGSSGKESGLLDLLNELQAVLEDTEDDSEEVDILETAKQCGWTFPRVRWWPPDGEDWSHGLP